MIIKIFIFAVIIFAILPVGVNGEMPITYKAYIDDGYGFFKVRDITAYKPAPFEGRTLTINTGDTVIWESDVASNKTFTLVSEQNLWNENDAHIKGNSRFSHLFTIPGTYNIYIREYPKLKMEIVVNGYAISITTPFPTPSVIATPVITDNSRIVFASNRDGDSDIYMMNTDGANVVQLTNDDGQDWDPRLFYNKIVFVSNMDGDNEIYIMNIDGTNITQLTDNNVEDIDSLFSPDGNKIVFVSNRTGGDRDIYTMNIDGTNVIPLTDNTAIDETPSWSPDGSKIAFASNRNGNFDAYIMNADGTNVIQLTNSIEQEWPRSWSPDGSKIALHYFIDNSFDIYTINTDGTNIIRLTNNAVNDSEPFWSPDGSKIIFFSDRDGDNEIYVMNTDGTDVVQLTNNSVADFTPYWSTTPISNPLPTITTSVSPASTFSTPNLSTSPTPTPTDPMDPITYRFFVMSVIAMILSISLAYTLRKRSTTRHEGLQVEIDNA